MRAFIAAMYFLGTMLSTTQTHAQSAEAASAEIRFDTIDVPDALYTYANAINDQDVIVGLHGHVTPSEINASPFLAIDDLFVTDLVGVFFSRSAIFFIPDGINDLGHVVGYDDATRTGVLFANGVTSRLEMPGASGTSASDINNRGQIVGRWEGPPQGGGFLLSGGRYTKIRFPRSLNSNANGINDRGQIVGDFSGEDLVTHGFVSLRGRFTAINVPGYVQTSPRDINNLGQIVGVTIGSSYSSVRGFLLWHGQYSIIHIPGSTTTTVDAINDSGTIVGAYVDSAGRGHGFKADVYQFVQHE